MWTLGTWKLTTSFEILTCFYFKQSWWYPGCQRLFKRCFRIRSKLKSACSCLRPKADEAPCRTLEKTSGTQRKLMKKLNHNLTQRKKILKKLKILLQVTNWWWEASLPFPLFFKDQPKKDGSDPLSDTSSFYIYVILAYSAQSQLLSCNRINPRTYTQIHT